MLNSVKYSSLEVTFSVVSREQRHPASQPNMTQDERQFCKEVFVLGLFHP